VIAVQKARNAMTGVFVIIITVQIKSKFLSPFSRFSLARKREGGEAQAVCPRKAPGVCAELWSHNPVNSGFRGMDEGIMIK
jgi:hypothetical protein